MGLRDLTDAELGHIVRDSPPLANITCTRKKRRKRCNVGDQTRLCEKFTCSI
jgi:hypothetical protein